MTQVTPIRWYFSKTTFLQIAKECPAEASVTKQAKKDYEKEQYQSLRTSQSTLSNQILHCKREKRGRQLLA
ncbi:MAG: hypothetical protein ABI668_03735 [Sphingorhabdus sp.]